MSAVQTGPTVTRGFAQWRFVQLTAVMLAYLLFAPWLASLSLLKLIAQLVLFNTLLVTISATTGRTFDRRMKTFAWGFFGLSVAVTLLGSITGGDSRLNALWHAEVIVSALLQLGCVAGILNFIARSRKVTIDIIFAAIMAYILIAVVFAGAYLLIWDLNPGAFPSIADQSPQSDHARITMLYFSFVTMATLGYGDITATDPFARMITIIEAMTGQFYVAVLVGLLVGLYISHSAERRA